MANVDTAGDTGAVYEGGYEDEGQFDDQAGIGEGAAEGAEGEEEYAEAEEEPAAQTDAAAPSNGASRKHKPIMFPADTEAGKAAAGVPLEVGHETQEPRNDLWWLRVATQLALRPAAAVPTTSTRCT